MSRSCCAAPVLFRRRLDASSIAVAPPWKCGSVPSSLREVPGAGVWPNPEAEEAARVLRDGLAVAAKTRYHEWASANAASPSSPRTAGAAEAEVHPSLYVPRSRRRELELAGEWAGANKVKTERERIEDALHEATDRFLTRSCYPPMGSPVRNFDFSYTWGYDFRRREKSKEISGTFSSLRTRPRTQAERINACAADAAGIEAISGERPTHVVDGWRAKQWPAKGFSATFPSSPQVSPGGYVHHPTPFVDRPHAAVEASLHAHRAGRVPGGNLLSGRGTPTHLSPSQRAAREAGFNPVSPGQSPHWPRPPPTAAGTEPYIPHPSPPCAPVDWSVRSTGQLPPTPIPPKSYRRSVSPAGFATLRN